MAMDDERLTEEEKKAIKSLMRLGKKWPKTLIVFGRGGTSLSIRKPDENGNYGYSMEVADVEGFSNDGGDGADEFD